MKKKQKRQFFKYYTGWIKEIMYLLSSCVVTVLTLHCHQHLFLLYFLSSFFIGRWRKNTVLSLEHFGITEEKITGNVDDLCLFWWGRWKNSAAKKASLKQRQSEILFSSLMYRLKFIHSLVHLFTHQLLNSSMLRTKNFQKLFFFPLLLLRVKTHQ